MSFKSTINFFIKLQPSGKEIIKMQPDLQLFLRGSGFSPDTQLYKVKSSVLDLKKSTHKYHRKISSNLR